MSERNSIEFKVWGRYALFTDPLTRIGGEKCSYHIPTYESLKDPKLANDPLFKPFMEIFQNENSYLLPLTPAASAPADLLADFQGKWEAGKVSDLQAGLEDLANAVDQQVGLG